MATHYAQVHEIVTNQKLDGSDPHWIQDLASKCWSFDPVPAEGETVSWSGDCRHMASSNDS